MGFCCQGLENPLLMEREKAEKDSESKGGEEGCVCVCVCVWGITKMSASERLQRQCIVFARKPNGAEPEGLRRNIITSSSRNIMTSGGGWVISKEHASPWGVQLSAYT